MVSDRLKVEEVLNCKVSTTSDKFGFLKHMVEEILDYKVLDN
jgi:hypothetical protein